MEGALSGAESLAGGGCQLDFSSCEKTICSADKCPTLSVETESSGAERRDVGRSTEGPRAGASVTMIVEGGWPDKNQIALSEPVVTNFETLSRKEKRKSLKKLRRQQIRQEAAEKEKLEVLKRSQDPAEQLRIQEEEKLEAERLVEERLVHEEQERLFQEREKKSQEEFERKQVDFLEKEQERKLQQDEEENCEYVDDDGPAEIIWQGNEIIVRKKRVKLLAQQTEGQSIKNADQPTSNPLPPQSTAFAAYKCPPPATPDVAEQNPMFGTEQDKTHCPFHIKTGVCRFGTRCSRVHVYPDQSFTLLIRNMYSGPGLSWDHDEGLEEGGKLFWCPDGAKGISVYHSDEEVAEQYEEFYEDVHSEFLQFGELVNFKVSKNGSSHLRGNVYVHYQTEAGAQAAYNAMNGRFYAGKQITCEFVGVTRWRVALCGEYMKGHHRPCSHGSACNFLHCFRNPRGEYDWADWDSPPPRYWLAKMSKRFGYVRDHREDDDTYHGKSRERHRSSESARSSKGRHRREDKYSRVDPENGSHRGHRRHRSRGESYQSSSDDSECLHRHERRRRRKRSSPVSVGDGSRRRTYGDLHEKGRRYYRDSVHNLDTSEDEAASVGGDELKHADRGSDCERDHEVDAVDLHRKSRRRRNRGTTPEEDRHKYDSTRTLSIKGRSNDVQIHNYGLSNVQKRSSSGSPEKDAKFVKRTSETEAGSGSKISKRELATRERSLSRRSSKRSSKRSIGADSSDAEIDASQRPSRSESKRDSSRILRGEKCRHEVIDSNLVVQEDRWRPDVDIYH